MRTLRYGEVDCLAQGLISHKWQSRGLDLGSLAAEPIRKHYAILTDSVCVRVGCLL